MAHGGAKALAGGAIPLSYPQIRRMANDGGIPNLGQILAFLRLAGPSDPFRLELIDCLSRLFEPDAEELANALEEQIGGRRVTGSEAAAAVRDVCQRSWGWGKRWTRTASRPRSPSVC